MRTFRIDLSGSDPANVATKEEAMDRSGQTSIDQYVDATLSPVVRDILRHLCEGDHPSYGSIVEWCETRGDCAQAVVCPHCGAQYLLDEEEMVELRMVSARTNDILSCGVVFDH